MNGQRAGVGDPIVLRQIHHDAESGERGRGLANGDLLRIESIDGDRVMVRRQIAANPVTGERRYSEPFPFAYAAESQLGHVVTEHRAQGSTVTAGISLFTGSESPDWAYPALTRGALGNYAIVFTRPPNRADPRPGTRKAPELVEWARVQNERAALDKPAWPDPEAGDDARAGSPRHPVRRPGAAGPGTVRHPAQGPRGSPGRPPGQALRPVAALHRARRTGPGMRRSCGPRCPRSCAAPS